MIVLATLVDREEQMFCAHDQVLYARLVKYDRQWIPGPPLSRNWKHPTLAPVSAVLSTRSSPAQPPGARGDILRFPQDQLSALSVDGGVLPGWRTAPQSFKQKCFLNEWAPRG